MSSCCHWWLNLSSVVSLTLRYCPACGQLEPTAAALRVCNPFPALSGVTVATACKAASASSARIQIALFAPQSASALNAKRMTCTLMARANAVWCAVAVIVWESRVGSSEAWQWPAHVPACLPTRPSVCTPLHLPVCLPVCLQCTAANHSHVPT